MTSIGILKIYPTLRSSLQKDDSATSPLEQNDLTAKQGVLRQRLAHQSE
jgi:hypothetical protein